MTMSTTKIAAEDVKVGYSVVSFNAEHGDEEVRAVEEIGVHQKNPVDKIFLWFEDESSLDFAADEPVSVLLSDIDY